MDRLGFIVSAWEEPRGQGAENEGRIFLTGRLEDGQSFAAMVPHAPAALYVPLADGLRALEVLRVKDLARGASLDPEPWSNLEGTQLARIVVSRALLSKAEKSLQQAQIRLLAREWPRADQTIAQLGLTGPVRIRGDAQPGKRVDNVFVEPELSPSIDAPKVAWMALDIETARDGSVLAVSLTGAGGPGEVLFLGRQLNDPRFASYPTERELLAALAERITARDPDVITGWNVIDFDLSVLFKRFGVHGVPFVIGRTAEPCTRRGEAQNLRVPGRAVLDGMRLVQGSGERHASYSLQAVSQTVLGGGKSIATQGEEKLTELYRQYREEPEAFCAYCLLDSELVLRILEKTGLDALTARRAALTGVPLELAWTSIPAFERIYGSSLREKRVLPPEKEERDVSGAAGGTVLDAFPGIFHNVLVFDFRSLYPSIIRSFNIDPLSHARALGGPEEIVAPNGARFAREPGILPGIIGSYAREREEALVRGDETAAYVYKILQNSFYGVLGASGCRYARTELAGAITSFGKKYLTQARDFFEVRGARVLYGDTDSVFVLSTLAESASYAELIASGRAAEAELNEQIARSIREEFGVESFLRIRCDKVYRRFFIPRIKSDSSGNGRGRAKGYAGYRLSESDAPKLEVKGMEAARSDFTALARRLQRELLALAFEDSAEDKMRDYCRAIGKALRAGELDAELVYRKSLRRSAEEYGSETPQVRAARLLGWTHRKGRISYVITKAGAEPTDARSKAPLDYTHYLESQLLPIALSVAEALGFDGRHWLEQPAQLEMFG